MDTEQPRRKLCQTNQLQSSKEPEEGRQGMTPQLSLFSLELKPDDGFEFWMQNKVKNRCQMCGQQLTATEKLIYGGFCINCEIEKFAQSQEV